MNLEELHLTLLGKYLLFTYIFSLLGFKNIALYLLTKMGTPADVIH